MKLVELFKQEPPFADTRRKLRAAIEAGKTTEESEAIAALQLIFASDSLDIVDFVMALEEQGAENFLPGRTVRDLIRHMDRLDQEYEMEHEK
jgi:hypothetical protein